MSWRSWCTFRGPLLWLGVGITRWYIVVFAQVLKIDFFTVSDYYPWPSFVVSQKFPISISLTPTSGHGMKFLNIERCIGECIWYICSCQKRERHPLFDVFVHSGCPWECCPPFVRRSLLFSETHFYPLAHFKSGWKVFPSSSICNVDIRSQ
jgi:hypothetical protein